MKRIVLLLAGLAVLWPVAAQAQQQVSGNLSTVAAACGTPPVSGSTGYLFLPVGTNNGSATFNLGGTWSGTMSFFGSADGAATWKAIGVLPSTGTGTAVTTATANGAWQFNPGAYTHVCIAFTTATSGTAVTTINLGQASARAEGGSGSSSGTISGQANGVIPLGTTATSITQQSHLDDGVTKAGFIASSEPISAVGYNSSSVFDCASYVNLNACLDAAKSYVGNANNGTDQAAYIFIHSGSQSLTGPYTLVGGMQLYGVMPRVEYINGVMPDLDALVNGGTWIDCGSFTTTCFTGTGLRGVKFENIGFKDFGTIATFGGNNVDGISFSTIENIYAVGNTSVGTPSNGFVLYNFQHVRMDHINIFNVNSGLNLIQQSSLGLYGNSTISDVVVFAYAKSVANSNNGTGAIWLQVLTPSSGTAQNLNVITMSHIEATDGAGDGTGHVMIVAGIAAASVSNCDFYGLELETSGGGGDGIYKTFANNNFFEISDSFGNTNDVNFGTDQSFGNTWVCQTGCSSPSSFPGANNDTFLGFWNRSYMQGLYRSGGSATGNMVIDQATIGGVTPVTAGGTLSSNQPMVGGGSAASATIATTFSGLTDGATVTWAIGSAWLSNRTLLFTTHGGSRTLNITGLLNGGDYVLEITQDATGGEGLTLGTGCTWKVSVPGSGYSGSTITPQTGANAIDVLAFKYDGTNCLATFN